MTVETLINQLSIYPKNANVRLVINESGKEFGIIGFISPINVNNIICGHEFNEAVNKMLELKISITDCGEITS